MNSLLCLLVFIGCACFSLGTEDTVDTFEFGFNEGRVSFSTSGDIGLFTKVVRIPVVVPSCTRLTYIRVDVDNSIGPPMVTLDLDMSTVVIKYRKLQHSKSTYTVTAKAVREHHCSKDDD